MRFAFDFKDTPRDLVLKWQHGNENGLHTEQFIAGANI